jgi:acyl-CoA dehydrogenase
MQLYEGTSQIQRLVIAREVLMPRRIEEPAQTEPLAAAA